MTEMIVIIVLDLTEPPEGMPRRMLATEALPLLQGESPARPRREAFTSKIANEENDRGGRVRSERLELRGRRQHICWRDE